MQHTISPNYIIKGGAFARKHKQNAKNKSHRMANTRKKHNHPGFSKEHPLIINGRIYAQNITGVQRFGIEIIQQMDTMVKRGEVILALPEGPLVTQPELKNIKTEVIGKGNGNKWSQVYLPLYAYKKKGTILTLAGIAPILKPDYMTTHDISFIRYPESYGRAFRTIYRIGFFLTIYRCKGIITISKFSRDELMKYYRLSKDRFTIVGNSAEQILRERTKSDGLKSSDAEAAETKSDGSESPKPESPETENLQTNATLAKWGLKSDVPYYLSVGSKNLHKNQRFILKLAKKYPDRTFVVAGGSSARSFGNSGDMTGEENNKTLTTADGSDNISVQPNNGNLSNVIFTGYISDEELITLYSNAYAFIFPSLYEGFGIPPLEAILAGVKRVALSDIPVFREIYTKGCYFFDPTDVDSFDIDQLDGEPVSDEIRSYYINKYSWKNSAKTIINMIK